MPLILGGDLAAMPPSESIVCDTVVSIGGSLDHTCNWTKDVAPCGGEAMGVEGVCEAASCLPVDDLNKVCT